MNSRRCDFCNIDVHSASYAKDLRSKKHLENEMIIPEWLFYQPIGNNSSKKCNPKRLNQIARSNFRLDDKQLNKELARKMNNPYCFTDRALQVGFNIGLDSHHINRSKSKINIKPIFPNFGIEFRYLNKILKEMAIIYARLINQCKLKYQTVFAARFDKQKEVNQVLD